MDENRSVCDNFYNIVKCKLLAHIFLQGIEKMMLGLHLVLMTLHMRFISYWARQIESMTLNTLTLCSSHMTYYKLLVCVLSKCKVRHGCIVIGSSSWWYYILTWSLHVKSYLQFGEPKGHFTHKPRAETMKLWELIKKSPKAVPTHLQHHVVWSQTLECSVKSYVTKPSTKCYFKEFLFIRILTRDKRK